MVPSKFLVLDTKFVRDVGLQMTIDNAALNSKLELCANFFNSRPHRWDVLSDISDRDPIQK